MIELGKYFGLMQMIEIIREEWSFDKKSVEVFYNVPKRDLFGQSLKVTMGGNGEVIIKGAQDDVLAKSVLMKLSVDLGNRAYYI